MIRVLRIVAVIAMLVGGVLRGSAQSPLTASGPQVSLV